jgi:hypothetical protein
MLVDAIGRVRILGVSCETRKKQKRDKKEEPSSTIHLAARGAGFTAAFAGRAHDSGSMNT